MEHRSLGRSGLKVSSLCLGAMTFGESQGFMKGVTSSDDEARRVLDIALDAGIDFVDTANIYSEGRSEMLLGQWLRGKREKVVLATKCRFPTGPGPHDAGLSRKHILRACDDSLHRLQTDYIDLYQVHMQDRSVPIEETLRALDDLVRAGKVRYAGCSNYTGYRLTESLFTAEKHHLHRYESVQLQWSLLVRDAEREVVPACRAFGLGVLVWSPLARGMLSGKYQRNMPPPQGSRLATWKETYEAYAGEARTWNVIDAVVRIAKEHAVAPSTVALAWLLARSEVSSVIIGARNADQLHDNLAAANLKLSPQELAALDEVSEPDWGYPYNFIGNREPW